VVRRASASLPTAVFSFAADGKMSFSDSDEDYRGEGLEEYARTLINSNLDLEENSRCSVCIAVAGGGGHAISTLAATSGASSILLEGTVAYDRRAFRSYVGLTANNSTKVRYNSLEAAKLASETALKRAMNFKTHNLKQMNGCVGVGCASALVSSSSPDSVKGSGFIVATRADGAQLSIDVSLASMADSNGRTRMEEDIFISHLILRSIELISLSETGIEKIYETQTNAGDIIREEWGMALAQKESDDDTAFCAAQRLLDGDEQALVLLPVYKEGRPVRFRALKYPVIPDGSLVMPGSFNPPHKGHISLGQAAVRAAERMGYSTRHEDIPVFMELSLTNADKPPIDPQTASERIQKFLQLEDLPHQWGLVLTRAPLFSQKVACLQDCIMERADGKNGRICFVIGADTLARLLNPKYYNDDKDQMIDALLSMKGAHFFAGGRVEQKKDSSGPAQFITGKEELSGLPQNLKDKFSIIEEQEFRVDISSTEIRQREEAKGL
jgi:nicotinic acid mononucleotide adenylyltransferase/nicotinamide mononucleotide (NMN) deamidase PncC